MRIKLNKKKEQVVRSNSNQNKKEEDIMKKLRKYLAVLMAAIMVVSMVACGNDNTSSNRIEDDEEEVTVVEEKPEPEPEPVVPIVVEQTDPQPVEQEPIQIPQEEESKPEPSDGELFSNQNEVVVSVSEDNPNVIDGVDFTPYIEEEKTPYEVMALLPYDELRWLVTTDNREVVTTLADGDSFEMDAEKEAYVLALYSPQEITEVVKKESRYGIEVYDGIQPFGKVCVLVIFGDDDIGEEMPVDVTVNYDDGTSESIAITLTRSE